MLIIKSQHLLEKKNIIELDAKQIKELKNIIKELYIIIKKVYKSYA